MKILVAIKRAVDYNVRIRLKPDGSDVDLANVKMAINPFDEIALEAAVQLKEAGIAREVIAVSCGASACQEQLRTALALGADRAVLVDSGELVLQPLAVAKLLKALCLREQPGLALLGKQAIDDDANQTGQMLAALLGWPQATFASQLAVDVAAGRTSVTREIDGGQETLSLALPAVVSCDLRLNTPRYASLGNIIKAKKIPIEVLAATALVAEAQALAPRLTLLRVSEPPARPAGVRLGSVAELVDKLVGDGLVGDRLIEKTGAVA